MRPPPRARALAPALALALALPACNADPCESAGVGRLCLDLADARSYAWGMAPTALAIADVDADGSPDIIAASGSRGTVTVVWGGTDMSEGTATTWPVAREVADIVVADFDGDGHLDLATAVPHAAAVAVLRGRGGRALATAEQIPVGAAPRALLAIDLDHAGPLELVVANEADGTLSILRGLVPAPPVPVGPGPRDLAAADFDGDGHLDLAVALTEAASVQLMLGDGRGHLTAGPAHAVGVAPFAVVAADLDADHAVDLAVLHLLDDNVTILLGDGHGSLRARTTWPVDPDPRALALVPTLDPAGAQSHVLAVMSGATGRLQHVDPRGGVTMSGAVLGGPLAVGDLDGDGRSVLLHSIGGEFGALAPGPGLRLDDAWAVPTAGSVVLVDLDGDAIDELLIPVPPPDLTDAPAPPPDPDAEPETLALAIWRGDEPLDIELDTGLHSQVLGALAADLDGDGRRDLVVWDSFAIAVLLRHGDDLDLAFDPGIATPMSFRTHSLVAGDGDGDGQAELAIIAGSSFVIDGQNASYSVPMLLALGPDGALVIRDVFPTDDSVYQLSTLDLDRDGRTDLFLHTNNGLLLFEDMRLDLPPRPIALDGFGNLGAFEFVDDDPRDALVCSARGLVHVRDLFGHAPAPTLLDRYPCYALAAADLDHDGASEILAQRSMGGTGNELLTYLTPWRRDDGTWRPLASQSVLAKNFFRLTQLDDDGVIDLLVVDLDNRTRAISMSLGTAIEDTPRARLGNLGGLQLGDFDGDGALDLFGYGQALGFAFGDGDGGFGPTHQQAIPDVLPASDGINSAAIADFDRDGVDDIVIAARDADLDRTDIVALAVTDGRARRSQTLATFASGVARLAFGDLDDDGALDLLAFAPQPAPDGDPDRPRLRTAFFRREPDHFAAPRYSDIDFRGSTNSLRLLDLDRDGRLDLVGSDTYGLGVISLNAGRGRGRFSPTRTWLDVGLETYAVGDIDRDGDLDTLATLNFWYSEPRNPLVLILGGTDPGTARRLILDVTAFDLVDLDGDGELELLATSSDLSRTTLHIGRWRDGDYTFTRHSLDIASPRAIQALDVDRDGALDIVLHGYSAVTTIRQRPS